MTSEIVLCLGGTKMDNMATDTKNTRIWQRPRRIESNVEGPNVQISENSPWHQLD